MRRISVKLVLSLAAAAASLVWGQSLSPNIFTLVPATVPAGSNATTLTVNGANFLFVAGQNFQSSVLLNGVAVATTFVNSGTLTIDVPASLLLSPSQYTVQVANPNETFSNTVTFSVLAPGISYLSTTFIPAGSPAFGLSVTGVNFLSGSQVSFRSATLATKFVDSTTLTATVPAALIAVPGQVNVQVMNPGGSSSGRLPFMVGPPLVAISPSSSVPSGVV